MEEPKQIKLSQFWSYDKVFTEDKEKARKRFTELFRTNKSSGKGGSGEVFQVQNVFGEVFAMKLPNLDVSYIKGIEAKEKNRIARIEAFKQEYKNQATFCKGNNFPQVYGLGELDGTPVMLMEWIDGGTITSAHELKQEDPNHKKVTPRIVAKLGIQLLQMIENLQYKDEAFVHRDISAGNIMFRTTNASVEQQLKDENFDLCLIDFGSSHVSKDLENPSFTQLKGFVRRGTPEYASPEMLTEDLPNIELLRKSTKIDSYAICSVLYELLTGLPPYDLKHAPELSSSWYLHKLQHKIRQAKTLHADSPLSAICSHDWRIKAMWKKLPKGDNEEACELAGANSVTARKFLNAINKADAQLSLILLKGLIDDQEMRANPTELRLMLQEFLKNYETNIQRAFFEKPLLPYLKPSSKEEVSQQITEQPVVLMQAVKNPKHYIVSQSFHFDDHAQLLFEREKKKIEFSKGIFAFGDCLILCITGIVAACLNGSLYSATTSIENVTQFRGFGFFLILIFPILLASLVFLITPKKGADLIAGTGTIIVTTLFTRVLMSAWVFVSDYVIPVLTITQLFITLAFVITICASRRQV